MVCFLNDPWQEPCGLEVDGVLERTIWNSLTTLLSKVEACFYFFFLKGSTKECEKKLNLYAMCSNEKAYVVVVAQDGNGDILMVCT